MDRIPLFMECEPKNMEKDQKCFQKQMQKHIKKHFRYPEDAKANYIEGVVYIMMTIEADGTLSNIRTKGAHPLLEKEAVRIMRLLPKFRPAIHEGEAVSVPYSIPLTFRL
ncbi:MAG: energy transducer TonB [Flavobacteriaceae bacterium]